MSGKLGASKVLPSTAYKHLLTFQGNKVERKIYLICFLTQDRRLRSYRQAVYYFSENAAVRAVLLC